MYGVRDMYGGNSFLECRLHIVAVVSPYTCSNTTYPEDTYILEQWLSTCIAQQKKKKEKKKKGKRIGEIHNPWTRKLPFLAAGQIWPTKTHINPPFLGESDADLNPFFAPNQGSWRILVWVWFRLFSFLGNKVMHIRVQILQSTYE